MKTTKDLRYQRTEKAIRKAFMKLVSEQAVTSVSVKDLCQRAGISRNAFYLHHTGVVGLYTMLVQELIEDMRSENLASATRTVSTGDNDPYYELMLSTLARHEEFLRALLPSDDGSLVKCLAESIEKVYVESALLFGEHGGSFEHGLRCSFAAWGLVGFVARWVAGTDRPLTDGLETFKQVDRSAVEVSMSYLLAGQQRERESH